MRISDWSSDVCSSDLTYPAADGVSIPAYLTLPPGKEAKNLPAIVLPHGGPAARDEWGFDWLSQYLASLGYAVLQPNYRSEERRVGKECVSPCRSRWSP